MRGFAVGKLPTPFFERIFFKTLDNSSERHWRVYSRTTVAPGVTITQHRRDGFKSAAMIQNSFEISGKYFSVIPCGDKER